MCSRMEAKLMNSSDESSIGSAVYFSSKVFTENLPHKDTATLSRAFWCALSIYVCATKQPGGHTGFYGNDDVLERARI